MPRNLGGLVPGDFSNRQTDLGIGCGNREPANLPRPLSAQSGKNLESAALGRYPCMKENLQKSSFPKERFQHTILEKKNEFDCSGGGGKRNFPRSPTP